jgi:hypothetical protein
MQAHRLAVKRIQRGVPVAKIIVYLDQETAVKLRAFTRAQAGGSPG